MEYADFVASKPLYQISLARRLLHIEFRRSHACYMCCGWIGLDGKEGCGRGIVAMICSVDTLEERSDGLHDYGIHVSFIYENKALKSLTCCHVHLNDGIKVPLRGSPASPASLPSRPPNSKSGV